METATNYGSWPRQHPRRKGDRRKRELTSIPRASYSFSLNHDRGANQNRKIPIGFRHNQARTDDFHYVKETLYH
ncbi:hypothetical protein PHJA_000479200 [Phtheirospermum japonicum]|uniref:Uncharacterized protein n=1 Tax=Phtheirospermum japonicum TaxID=374723 RepID=A0A830BE04_9LAMI|nr:hypothetical protein PHJA_000479200 [Phtheirospermum japonicum]